MRSRIRGCMSGKTGKAVGITSVTAPLIGFLVHDLKKPDSLIRQLAGKAVRGLLEWKKEKRQVIDITDRVEIVEDRESSQSD